ncbi:ankyrin repeat protein [Jimgerdemannia flammicorona]|uniref:Ankyrin repeat protein n=1 Tax=Jimgerdemannia flammicorona TaxID=994334 RepID=A0A433QVL7_9FUNG|nr:ankyrin repeat protein [Jimgerdemannia flammicorona]
MPSPTLSHPTEDTIDDIIQSARHGDLDDLRSSSHPPHFLAAKDEFGNTALHMASANGHLETVEYLLATLATLSDVPTAEHINTRNEQGNTPLHWAALNGHLEVVEALVKRGADCKVRRVHSGSLGSQRGFMFRLSWFSTGTPDQERRGSDPHLRGAAGRPREDCTMAEEEDEEAMEEGEEVAGPSKGTGEEVVIQG